MLGVISSLAAILLGIGFFALPGNALDIHPLLGNESFATALITLGVVSMFIEFRLLFTLISLRRTSQEHKDT